MMDKAWCVALTSCGSLCCCLFIHPWGLGEKGPVRTKRGTGSSQKPESFHGRQGNVAREASGGWTLNLLVEFPSLITHLQSARRSREGGCLPPPYSWTGPRAGRARTWCSCILSCSVWAALLPSSAVPQADRPTGMPAQRSEQSGRSAVEEVEKAVLMSRLRRKRRWGQREQQVQRVSALPFLHQVFEHLKHTQEGAISGANGKLHVFALKTYRSLEEDK